MNYLLLFLYLALTQVILNLTFTGMILNLAHSSIYFQVKHIQLLRCPEPYLPVWYKTVVATNNEVWVHRPGQSHDTMAEVHNITEAPITAMDISANTHQLTVGVSMLGGPQQACKVRAFCREGRQLWLSIYTRALCVSVSYFIYYLLEFITVDVHQKYIHGN